MGRILSGVADPFRLSKNRVDKAGKFLRDLDQLTLEEIDRDRLLNAFGVVQSFRDEHAYPMLKVRNGLQRFLVTTGVAGHVTQRHKRVPRILRKLRRMRDSPNGGSGLYRMHDIGGCRVVLASVQDLDKYASHVRKRWGASFIKDHDYVSGPKPMGYRALHYVVQRDGRAIEVQLRTRGQQQWADAVESADSRIPGVNLKDESGPIELTEYFRVTGDVIHHREHGLDLPASLVEEFEAARSAVIAAGHYSG